MTNLNRSTSVKPRTLEPLRFGLYSERSGATLRAMDRHEKLLEQILSGEADANIHFADLCTLLQRLGFGMQIRGSHHVFRKVGCGIINLQPARPTC